MGKRGGGKGGEGLMMMIFDGTPGVFETWRLGIGKKESECESHLHSTGEVDTCPPVWDGYFVCVWLGVKGSSGSWESSIPGGRQVREMVNESGCEADCIDR